MNRSELAPQRLCESCAQTPAGVDGHDGLQQFDGPIQPSTPGSIVFECRGCHALWARRYTGGGRFEWTFESPGVGKGPRS